MTLRILPILLLVIAIGYQNCSEVGFGTIEPGEKLDSTAPMVKGVSAPGQPYVPDYMTVHGSNKVMSVTLVQTMNFQKVILEFQPTEAVSSWEPCVVEYEKTPEQLQQDEIQVPVDCWMPIDAASIKVKGINSKKEVLVQPEQAVMNLDNIDVDHFETMARALTPKEWIYPVRNLWVHLTQNVSQRRSFNQLEVRILNQASTILCSKTLQGSMVNDGWVFSSLIQFTQSSVNVFTVDCKLQANQNYSVEILGKLDGVLVHKDIRSFEVVEPAFIINSIKVVSDTQTTPFIEYGGLYNISSGSNKRLELNVHSNNPAAIAHMTNQLPNTGVGLRFTYPAANCVFSGSYGSNPMYQLVSTPLGGNNFKISIPYSGSMGNCNAPMDNTWKGLVPIDISLVYGSGFGASYDNIPAKQFWFYHGYINATSSLTDPY
jgi:hypothetical protein